MSPHSRPPEVISVGYALSYTPCVSINPFCRKMDMPRADRSAASREACLRGL